MGITPNLFNYYLFKLLIKGRYLVVKIGGIDITAENKIRKASVNTKSIAICAIKTDTGISYTGEFPSIFFLSERISIYYFMLFYFRKSVSN